MTFIRKSSRQHNIEYSRVQHLDREHTNGLLRPPPPWEPGGEEASPINIFEFQENRVPYTAGYKAACCTPTRAKYFKNSSGSSVNKSGAAARARSMKEVGGGGGPDGGGMDGDGVEVAAAHRLQRQSNP